MQVIEIVRNGIGNAMVWPQQIVVPFLGDEATPDDDIEGRRRMRSQPRVS